DTTDRHRVPPPRPDRGSRVWPACTRVPGAAMGALVLFTPRPNRGRGLFSRYREAEEGERSEEMLTVAHKIVTELTVHTTIEEEIFYPAVHDMSEDLADVVDEGVEEHHVAKVLIEELSEIET